MSDSLFGASGSSLRNPKMALGIIQALDSAESVEDPDRIYRDIFNRADTTQSLCVSIREAAFRRDSAWLRIHRAELIQHTRLLVGLIRDIAPLQGEGARQ
jgi:hypothetical protein